MPAKKSKRYDNFDDLVKAVSKKTKVPVESVDKVLIASLPSILAYYEDEFRLASDRAIGDVHA